MFTNNNAVSSAFDKDTAAWENLDDVINLWRQSRTEFDLFFENLLGQRDLA